jgi:hypothetical protein
LERLAAAGIQLLTPDAATHYLFARDSFVALVERRSDGVVNIGSTGVFTERGLAFLVRREERAFFVAKGAETPAEPAQLEALERFSHDLARALTGV